MDKDIEKLQGIAQTLRRMNNKVKLYNLITSAFNEYESYDFKTCKQTLEEAYKIEPLNPVVLRGLGCLAQFEKKYNKALELFHQALKTSEKKEIEYTLIGMVYYIQDKLDDAIKFFNLAIDANENYENAYEARNQAMLENHINILELQQALKKYL